MALCSYAVNGAAESFTVYSDTSPIEIRYFLSGAFGGYGAYVHDPDKDGAWRIPLEQEGRTAKHLKAILYAQGCQFSVLSVDLSSDPKRSAAFECRKLSTVTLRGRISPPPSTIRPLDVEILYLASWDHEFFGILDGMVQSFRVGKVPLSWSGQFEARIPNFATDRITNHADAYLHVLVVERSGGNAVEVLPPANLTHQKSGLKILPGYDSEITFRMRQ